MNKNRLGEEHPVKISKNNSLTSRAGFCLPSASQRSPGKPGGLGQLQRWKETSAKPGDRGEKAPRCRLKSHHDSHPREWGEQFSPLFYPQCFIPRVRVRMDGSHGRNAEVGEEVEFR